MDPEIRRHTMLINRLMRAYWGELEAISEYTYYSIVSEPTDPRASELFERISMDEMRHFRALGDAIRDLGANPVIRTCLNIEPLELRGTEVPNRLFDRLVRGEETARAEYLSLAELSDNADLSALLRDIADDEAHHARMLRGEV